MYIVSAKVSYTITEETLDLFSFGMSGMLWLILLCKTWHDAKYKRKPSFNLRKQVNHSL